MYLHKELETLTRPEIEKLQLERLQKTVRHCMNSPFYKQRFAENHLSPEDIRSLDDLQKKAIELVQTIEKETKFERHVVKRPVVKEN